MITNITNYGAGKGVVGGSTITQQVVKNFLLTNERSLKRKIREAVLAIRITNVYSKDRILELYLNEIYLGNRSYGIAAAAMNYFNRSLGELALEEIALLAALPKAPSKINPIKNYDRALERRNWVLGRMHDDNRISKQEMLEAQGKPIVLRKRDKQETIDAPYFASEVRRFLTKELGEKVVNEGGLSVVTTLSPTLQTYADKALRAQLVEYDRRRGFRGGVGKLEGGEPFDKQLPTHKARSMLLPGQHLAAVLKLQDHAAEIGLDDGTIGTIPMTLLKWTRRVVGNGTLGPAVNTPSDVLTIGDIIIVGPPSEVQRKKLPKEQKNTAWDLQQVPQVNGALVVSDPHSGKILAMSGGYSYAASRFNRATQAKRQPGSAFKPFVYMSALENGMTPATRVMDGPIELTENTGGEVWRPENFGADYLGPTTLRRGLEKSRNTMTVRLGQALGMKRIAEIGERFGIYQPIKHANLSMVLGTLETSVVNLVNAYASIANGGRKVEPILVERVEDRHGNIIYQRDLRGCPTCNVDEASWNPDTLKPPALFDTRERIVDARIAYQVTDLLQGVVKRGTAASAASLPWALGGKTGTTNESRDAWFAGISPDLVAAVYIGFDTPQPMGGKYTGSSLALPVFKSFIQDALAGTKKKEFIAPSGLSRVKVDAATGLALEPWEDDGRKTIWELLLRKEVDVFKTDTLLALGDLPPSHKTQLGMSEYLFDGSVGPQPGLPWQMQDNSPRPLGSYSDYHRNRHLPPSTYIAPNVNRYNPDPRDAYIPQVAPPRPAPIRQPRQPVPMEEGGVY